MKPASDIAAAYDRWAAQYDSDDNATRDLDAETLRRAPLRLANCDVLELGCGTGKNTRWLAHHARHVTALDFSAGMLARARERVGTSPVQFVRHDVQTTWPLPDGAVDVVVGNLVLEHVEHLPHVYHEAARVLRPGGQLFLCELHPFRQWRGGQAHFTEQTSGDVVHVSAFTHSLGDYVNAGIAAGFVLSEIGEPLEAGAPEGSPPRLLTLLFERTAGSAHGR